ncbi:hypothetical protein HKD37_04G010342 [Glycine soja]
MKQEKDWHENLFANKKCKQAMMDLHFNKDGEDYKVAETLISLVTTNQEEKHKSLINNYSYLPPIENLREYILECAKPLKKLLTNTNLTKKHVEENFLSLLRNGENLEKGIYQHHFKKWSKFYVLHGGWKKLFQIHKLQEHDSISVNIPSFNKQWVMLRSWI